MINKPHLSFLVYTVFLQCSLLGTDPKDFYTQIGTDPTFQELIDSGVIVPGVSSHPGPVNGSTIDVNNTLLEQQTGVLAPIPTDFRIHTQVNSSVLRGNFSKFSRWYQEDGRIQVMRLFQGEQNIRDGVGENGTPGRIEAFFPHFVVQPGTWSVWEATYTIIEPLSSNIFQLFHEGGQLWAFHLRMTTSGSINFARRRAITGLPTNITIATNMVGKSISFRVYANGSNYELYKKIPLVDSEWQLVTTGFYTAAVDNKISFRWGMYYGSQAGQSIPKDGLLFVNGVSRTTATSPGVDPPPPPPPPITYYWDNNGLTAGFGAASGVWGDTTSGNATQGWSSDPTGATLPADVSTAPTDPIFFGTDTLGLGTGTITLADTVSAADITFGSQSGNITLNGGEIAMSGNRSILASGSGKTHSIRSVLSGSGSRTLGGGSILVLSGENTFTGPLILGTGTSGFRVRFNTISDVNGEPSHLGQPTSDADGIIQIGANAASATLEFTGGSTAQSTNRRIRIGSNSSGGGGAAISNNHVIAEHTLSFTNSAFNVAATDTGTSNRTLVIQGSNPGDNLIQGAIINNVGTTGGVVSLTKSGTGTWVLSGNSSYTGNTTINSGTLRIGNATSSGTLSPSSSIINNGTLEFRRSNTITQGAGFSTSAISGSGSIIQSGQGSTVILNVANTYDGSTTINAGTIRITHGGALGGTAAGTVVNGSATSGGPRLELAGDITVTGEAISISGGGNFRGALSSQSGSNEWAGPVTITAPDTRIGASDGATIRVSGVIDSGGQTHGVIFRGGPVDTGAMIVSAANTYLGSTTLLIGKLQLEGGHNRLPIGSHFIMGNAGDRAELELNGNHQELAGLSLRSGVSAPSNNTVNNASATLSTLTINTATGSPSSFAGSLKGHLALMKTGADTFTLRGANTHTGATTVHQGTLALVGCSMTSPISVAAEAALGFTLGAPATSTASVNLTTGKVKVTGSVNQTSSYTLITASGGIQGTPTLAEGIPGYALQIQDAGTKLVLARVGFSPAYTGWAGSALPADDSNGDGVPNALAWALGAADPLANARPLLPTTSLSGNGMYLIFTFPRSAAAEADSHTLIAVEYQSNLDENWITATHDGDQVIIEVADGSPNPMVTVKFKRSLLAPRGRLFARLKVLIANAQ